MSALQRQQARIPLAPFLAFCAQREDRIRRQLDQYPAITAGRSGGTPSTPQNINVGGRLTAELGWSEDHGQRRLWQYRNHATDAPRNVIEDALEHAGENFHDHYPDEPGPPDPVPQSVVRIGQGQRMTHQQLRAAHTVYTQARLTLPDLADLLWQRYGYRTPASAQVCIRRGWQALNLPVRQCTALNLQGNRCGGNPQRGSDVCSQHAASRALPLLTDVITQARALHEDGMFLAQVARTLLDQTHYTNHGSLAARLSVIAHQQGWHRTSHYGQPRKRPVPVQRMAA